MGIGVTIVLEGGPWRCFTRASISMASLPRTSPSLTELYIIHTQNLAGESKGADDSIVYTPNRCFRGQNAWKYMLIHFAPLEYVDCRDLA